MAEEHDPSPGKRRRIIHWNPDAGKEQARRKWTWPRILLWTVGGFFALLFAAGGVIRLIRFVRPEIFQPQSASAAISPDPTAAFQSQANAEYAHTTATKNIAALSKLPFQDHPTQVEKFVLIQKDLGTGEALLAARDYAGAYAFFTALNQRIDEFGQSIRAKQDAQQAYDDIVVKLKDMEYARSLAPEALNAATAAASISQKLLADGDFLAAKKTLGEGMAQLKKAEQAVADYVANNIYKGQQALNDGDRQAAAAAFKAALEKAPANEDALKGLKRSDTIDRVHALLLQGADLEKQQQYAQAADAYKKAFGLDALSAAAQEGEARAARLEKEKNFNTAYAAAQEAFKAKDWDKVIAEAQNALKVDSSKTEVQDMLKSARENEHKEKVEKSLAKGVAAERTHDWVAAKDAYSETLTLEPQLQDAQDGFVRASQVIRALIQYKTEMDNAEKLASKADFQGSIASFDKAMEAKPDYLVPEDKVAALHALLDQQNHPVEISFHSDDKTFVSIGAFKSLGLVLDTTVKVMPGDYQVVGRRGGYKDVLINLQVRAGTPMPVVNVICEVRSDKG